MVDYLKLLMAHQKRKRAPSFRKHLTLCQIKTTELPFGKTERLIQVGKSDYIFNLSFFHE